MKNLIINGGDDLIYYFSTPEKEKCNHKNTIRKCNYFGPVNELEVKLSLNNQILVYDINIPAVYEEISDTQGNITKTLIRYGEQLLIPAYNISFKHYSLKETKNLYNQSVGGFDGKWYEEYIWDSNNKQGALKIYRGDNVPVNFYYRCINLGQEKNIDNYFYLTNDEKNSALITFSAKNNNINHYGYHFYANCVFFKEVFNAARPTEYDKDKIQIVDDRGYTKIKFKISKLDHRLYQFKIIIDMGTPGLEYYCTFASVKDKTDYKYYVSSDDQVLLTYDASEEYLTIINPGYGIQSIAYSYMTC